MNQVISNPCLDLSSRPTKASVWHNQTFNRYWICFSMWSLRSHCVPHWCFPCFHRVCRARFLPLARSKLRLCSANHRAGYFSNPTCDWLSIVWAYSEQETENGPRTLTPHRYRCVINYYFQNFSNANQSQRCNKRWNSLKVLHIYHLIYRMRCELPFPIENSMWASLMKHTTNIEHSGSYQIHFLISINIPNANLSKRCNERRNPQIFSHIPSNWNIFE